jgi:hypothetical protein
MQSRRALAGSTESSWTRSLQALCACALPSRRAVTALWILPWRALAAHAAQLRLPDSGAKPDIPARPWCGLGVYLSTQLGGDYGVERQRFFAARARGIVAPHGAMAVVLLGDLPRTPGHGLHGGCNRGVFWTGRCTPAALADRCRNGPVLWRMVLCATGQSRAGQGTARKGMKRMRVERERELRRRRKRREKMLKERRKAALMKAGKWPPTLTRK